MNTIGNVSVNWNSDDVLEQLLHGIKSPLDSIIKVSQKNALYDKEQIEEIVFSSSKEISDIVAEILLKSREKPLTITHQNRPEIFDIYESNENVRNMCSAEINSQKVTKTDQDWLVNLEKEVYDTINQDYLDLCELSYKMAVSERQLHRKIFNLISLTPNKYIRILRLHKAKQMIDNYVQHSIPQIAYAVGYTDVHYFSKLFTSQYSVSPRQLLCSMR